MAINLITGHSGSNHISSVDARAMNRATYGNGNYRLYAENGSSTLTAGCSVGKNTQSGTYRPNVGKGVIMWNGMFIRVDAQVNHTEYLESLNGLKIYLHYQKVSNVESVEFVFTFDDSAFASKIKANWQFTDSQTDVYALYYTFTNATGTSGTYSFAMKKAATDLIDELTTAFGTVNNALTTKADKTTTEAELAKRFSKSELQSMFCTHNTSDYRVLLGHDNVGTNTVETGSDYRNISLSEPITNFAFVEVRIGNVGNDSDYKFIVPSAYLAGNSNSAYGGSASSKRICWEECGYQVIWRNYTYMYSYSKTMRVGFINLYNGGGTFLNSFGSRSTYFYIFGVGRVAS